MNRKDLHVGQKVNVHSHRDVHDGEVTKIGRTLVTIKSLGISWAEGAQYYIESGLLKDQYNSGSYFFRTPEQGQEHEAYEKAMDVLKRHGFDAYRVQEKAKVIAVAGLLLNEFA